MKKLIAILLIISLVITPFMNVYAFNASDVTAEFKPGDVVSVMVSGNDWSRTRRMVVVQPSSAQDEYVTVMDLGAISSTAWWAGGGSIYNFAQGTIAGSLIEPLLGTLPSTGGNVDMGSITRPWTNIRPDYLPRLLNKEDLHHLGVLPNATAPVTGPVQINAAPATSILTILPGNSTRPPHETNFWTMICLNDQCAAGEIDDVVNMMVVTYNTTGNTAHASLQPARVTTLDDNGNPIPGNQIPQFLVRPVVQVHKRYIACLETNPPIPDCPEDCPPGTPVGTPGCEDAPAECLVQEPVDPETNEVLFPLVLIGMLALAGISFKLISKKSVFDRI